MQLFFTKIGNKFVKRNVCLHINRKGKMKRKLLTALSVGIILIFSACRKPVPVSLKAQWIRRAYASLQEGRFPRIRAVAWWNERFDESDLRINSSPQALEAYRQSVAPAFFTEEALFVRNRLVPPQAGMYHAAFPGFGGSEDSVRASVITGFEQLAGKRIAWAYFSDNWYHEIGFPYEEVETIHRAGRVPFIRMMPRSDIAEFEPDTVYTMQRIIDGVFDRQLLRWFTDAASTGYPLLVEFGTEVNGDWFPWNGLYNGGGRTDGYGDPAYPDGPERFRDAFRHLVELSRQAGATNITWFFHLDAQGEPEEDWNAFEYYFPGDDYVDWVGVSVYGPITPDDEYVEFDRKLGAVYDRMCRMTTRPLAVLETGMTEWPAP